MKNVPARNQKSEVRTAPRMHAPIGRPDVMDLALLRASGRAPTSAGSSFSQMKAGTSKASATSPRITAPARQPAATASPVRNGKNTS